MCIACGDRRAPAFLFRKSECAIVGCRTCGLAWVDEPSFSPQELYDEGYFTSERGYGYGDYVASEAVLRREFRATVNALSRHVAPRARVLEIGAAYGFFLLEARARFDVVGVELADGAARAARARGLDVRSGVYDEATADAIGEVDAAVMLDVIEHLPDPGEVVARIADHLAPGGALLVTTGDFGSLVGRASGKRWRLMTPPEHLFYFTESAIRRLLARAGLRVVEVVYPWKLVPIGLVLHQLTAKLGLPRPPSLFADVGVPLNLFDAMRVVAVKV